METVEGADLQSLLLELLKCGNDPNDANKILSKWSVNAEYVFKDVDWQALRKEMGSDHLKFARINWENRKLIFSGCDFGDGDLTLAATFDGPVYFDAAKFGNGNICFKGSDFQVLRMTNVQFLGRGRVDFSASTFSQETVMSFSDLGEKNLWFKEAYSKSKTTRSPCVFSGQKFVLEIKGCTGTIGTTIDFQGAKFDAVFVGLDFLGATNAAQIDFSNTEWQSPRVDLLNFRLGFERKDPESNHLRFTMASFERVKMLTFSKMGTNGGLISFNFARFPTQALTKISFTDVGNGRIDFSEALFPGNITFSQEEGAKFLANLTFRGATFKGALLVDNMKFGIVPDLTATEFQKHFSLANLKFGVYLSERDKRNEFDRAEKLRRLKELAEANRDHKLALDCHAEELQYLRFRDKSVGSRLSGVLDVAYQVTSDYGRSIALPVLWLLIVWSVFTIIYELGFPSIPSSGLFSAAWTFPFLPAAGVLRVSNFSEVFSQGQPFLFSLMGIQGLCSISLFFLIGLGFRNRFRI